MTWKFKKGLANKEETRVCFIDGFWYELTSGTDSLRFLQSILSDKEQIKVLNDAIELVHDFEETLYEQDFYDEC